jgi:uncharacterized protein (DUF983 family)
MPWTDQTAVALPRRDTWTALARGIAGRCPHCGHGKLFRAFLKVTDRCEACGEDFSHQRADDFPAYIVILIVGHILVPIALVVETEFSPSYPVQLAVWLPLALVLSLALLQPVKGAIVGLQWALRMHGFGELPDADAMPGKNTDLTRMPDVGRR